MLKGSKEVYIEFIEILFFDLVLHIMKKEDGCSFEELVKVFAKIDYKFMLGVHNNIRRDLSAFAINFTSVFLKTI